MLIEMFSPAFKKDGRVRPPIRFTEGLNVVLGQEDGAMSIGKSTALLAIDFAFGGDTYVKSDGVKHEGHHTIYFSFKFDGVVFRFARSTFIPNTIYVCDENYRNTDVIYTKEEYTNWLKEKYLLNYEGLSFRIIMSSFFRIYGKPNTDELNPLQGVPRNKKEAILAILTLFNRYKDIKEFEENVEKHTKKLNAYKAARDYKFVSDTIDSKKQYEENLAKIHELEFQLDTLMEEGEKGQTEEDIERNKVKAALTNSRLALENSIQMQDRKLRLINMNLEYDLYPTKADLSALQEFFPDVNLRKLYEIEEYHRKLTKILDAQFTDEKVAVESEIANLQQQLDAVKTEIKNLGIVGCLTREFLERHSALKAEISDLKEQNEAYLMLRELQDAKIKAEGELKRGIEGILKEIQFTLNTKMEELNDSLFSVKKEPPYVQFYAYNSYKFETPDNTGTGSNYKGMIVYDLAILFTTALPALAHDSLLFANLSKDVLDGVIRLYMSTTKQIFISYDKQGDCRPETQKILNERCVLRLASNNGELYGRSWDTKEQ